MNFNLKYLLKTSILLSIAIFVIERSLTTGGFNLSVNDLFKVFSIHFMYAFVLSFINGYFFQYLEDKINWKGHTGKRLIIGALGSVILTMIGLVVLRFVTVVIILGRPIESFLNDENAWEYYTFGFVITLIASLVIHAIFLYKALTEKKVKEQQIVAKTETAKYESLGLPIRA